MALAVDEGLVVEEVRRELARRHLFYFMDYCWWMPTPLIRGIHTWAITDRITRAVNDLDRGISTFLLVQVVFRHGKSDIVSRALPAWFLGRRAAMQPNVIMTGYGADLVESFSAKTKLIIGSERYQEVFPEVTLSRRLNAVGKWAVEGSVGEVNAVGLGGSITGKGGDLIEVDDYCKNREEAESQAYRDATWFSFTNDVLTRRSNCALVIVCATPWNVDDVAGRIKKAMVNDPDFPQFEVLKFAAEGEQYKSGYLFPEMYGPDWYRTQRATLGTYGAAGLMDCEPVVRGGNMLKTDGILKSEDMPEDVLWVRFWDLASTEKERAGDDPDFTVGAKVAIKMIDDVPWMYIADVRWCQAEAPARNKMIVATALADGPEVWQTAEQVAGYKDAVTTLRDILKGRSIVHGQTCSKDKVIRASALEPAFEAGHVVMRKAWWNDHAIEELGQFPSGPHDDIVDAISGGYAKAEERAKSVGKMGNGLGRGAKG